MDQGVLCIWSSSSENGQSNLQFGLETQTWGFKREHPDYVKPIRWVIFGSGHSGGSPRQRPMPWQAGTLSMVLCEFTAPLYVGRAPHWPDETESGSVIYPYRFGLTPVASLSDTPASATGVLGAAGTEALRQSASSNRGVRVIMDIEPLLDALGVSRTSQTSHPDLSRTAGRLDSSTSQRTSRRGAGRSADPLFNLAVETSAVELAMQHLLTHHGWDEVRPLGKPYDLVCTKHYGEEKHIEVKGTTGAGADVDYTPNEVYHFRTCPHGADLIVVSDIVVDCTVEPYATTGGRLLHIENYSAPAEDLQATGWRGRVPGWS